MGGWGGGEGWWGGGVKYGGEFAAPEQKPAAPAALKLWLRRCCPINRQCMGFGVESLMSTSI